MQPNPPSDTNCHVSGQTGFILFTEFTRSNCSARTNMHNLEVNTAGSNCYLFTIHCLVAASNSGDFLCGSCPHWLAAYFTTDGLPPNSSSWRRTHWDSLQE
jgi:hypothetical protein